MNAEDLRRLSNEAIERKARNERESEQNRRAQEAKESRQHEWANAAQAVADLNDNVRKAANQGKFETVVYRTWRFNVTSHCKKHWLTRECKGHSYDYSVPDYAQFVFNNCPAQLRPRWVVDFTNTCGGSADSRINVGQPAYPGYLHWSTYGYYLELRVSW